MTTSPVQSITDEQIGELEAICNEEYFDGSADMQELILALISRLRAAEKDAGRYRLLRLSDWNKSEFCVVRYPKGNIRLGTDCPSRARLDEMLDAAMTEGKP